MAQGDDGPAGWYDAISNLIAFASAAALAPHRRTAAPSG
jgi:hypothetical protein